MAAEMSILLPVYLMLVFFVLAFGDYLMVKIRTDRSVWYLTRKGQSLGQNQAKARIQHLWDGVQSGSLQVNKWPIYTTGTTSIGDISQAKFVGENLLRGASGSCDVDLLRLDPSYLAPYALFLKKGLKRSTREVDVRYRVQGRTYPWYALFPAPTFGSVAKATFAKKDGDREKGSWNSHNIENIARFQSIRYVNGQHGHVRFLIESAWYARHLGWYGYNQKNHRDLIPGLGPVGDTVQWNLILSPRGMYHPIQFTKKNYAHFNFYIRLPF